MKLCWSILDNMVLMPGRNSSVIPRLIYFEDGKSKGEFDLSEKPCKNCGNYFLQKIRSNSELCDKECKTEFHNKLIANKNINKVKNVDKRLKENGGGRHLIGNRGSCWNKGTALPKNSCNFKNFNKELSWFTETRRAPEDDRILQVKCCVCNSWFSPKWYRTRNIISYTYGKSEQDSWGFYCSSSCESKCQHFGKSTEQIMKQDYLNGGKAKYSEIHNIPDSILYYDWQEELKKKLLPLTKKYERKKLRRRKKRETELRRMSTKINHKKEPHIKSNKELKLTRLLYFSRVRAKEKGLPNDLDYDWFIQNTPEKCPKCNIEFSYDKAIKRNPFGPSIDRVDTNKCYVKNNCVVVSWMYNCGKNMYDDITLYKICKAFLENQRP